MTTALPDKIPLDMPPGEPAAIDEFVRSVAGAAHVLAVLAGEMEGPAATAPGWIGDDAAATAAQIGLVRDLVREIGGAVLIATGHLSAHADRLRDARRQVTDLRAEQDDDHAVAWSQWGELEVIRAEVQYDGASAVAVVEDLRASEEARRRRHAALLAEMSDDAAATARALADACVVVGGTGRPGDDSRAFAHVAVVLAGWGDAELAARGTAVAAALLHDEFTSQETETLVENAGAYAGQAAFASAFLLALGSQGMGQLLELLGSSRAAVPPSLPRVLACALGAVPTSDRDGDRIAEVLEAVYVHADDRLGNADLVATGMAAVLRAGGSRAVDGPRPSTIAEWVRQMMLREHATKANLGIGAAPAGTSSELTDPVDLAVSVLADTAEPAASAVLLAGETVWQALLARGWSDGGAALGRVVTSAALSSDEAGARAVRMGLAVVGEGLFEGDPSDWRVNRRVVDAVSPALGRAVASQVEVAVDGLSAGAQGVLGDRESEIRGLAYVSVSSDATRAIERALGSWASSAVAVGSGALSPRPEVAVPAGFLAVQEYGHRFSAALDSFERKDDAENSHTWWRMTTGALSEIAGESKVGAVIAVGLDYLQIAVGADGTWDNLPDHGLRITSDDAARAVHAWLPPGNAEHEGVVTWQAREAFERTGVALGRPEPQISTESDLLSPVLDAAFDGAVGRVGKETASRLQELVQSTP